MGGTATGIHFALGLGRLIRNPLHHWQARSDWIECFLWALAATVIAAMPTIWRFRRNRLRKLKQPVAAVPQPETPEPALPQPNPAEAAWKG